MQLDDNFNDGAFNASASDCPIEMPAEEEEKYDAP